MGCFNSKTKEDTADKAKANTTRKTTGGEAKSKAAQEKGNTGKSGAKTAAAAATSGPAEPVSGEVGAPLSEEKAPEKFLQSVLPGTEHCVSALPDSAATKSVIALTFANSATEVVRTKFRLKFEDVTALMTEQCKKMKLPLIEAAMRNVEERSMDDIFSRILLAWFSNNPTFQLKISSEAGQAVLDTLYIRYKTTKPVAIEDILSLHIRWAAENQASLEVFRKFAEGKDSMTPEQFLKFLRETQRVEVTDRQITEKFKYRFGNGIHRYNFSSYMGSVLTNNATDPAHMSAVWQDMTQAFTHYAVHCARVESEDDLTRAMNDSARALVLSLKKNANGQLMAGRCPLSTVLEQVKKNGFAVSTYPIVLCLSPGETLTADVQEAAAKQISEALGPMLAKGLMFEGAVISDPKFSPSALRRKVLIMCYQSPLRAFIGWLVADMNKDGLGVRITDVVEGAPAEKGGVLKNDWLTHINGWPIQNKQDLRQRLSQLQVGEEFVVKRENLDDLTIVVGGTVDPQDPKGAAALSELAFFRYAPAGLKAYKPWDVVCLSEATLPAANLTRPTMEQYFALVTVNGKNAASMTTTSNAGVQFVDVDNDDQRLAYTRGQFYENGRCGYLLKTNLTASKVPDVSISVIGGPRIISSAPLSSMTCVHYGHGTARVSGTQLVISGYDEASVTVATMTFDKDGVEHSFVASFYPVTARPGYRAMPSVRQSEEHIARRHIHGVYVFVKNG